MQHSWFPAPTPTPSFYTYNHHARLRTGPRSLRDRCFYMLQEQGSPSVVAKEFHTWAQTSMVQIHHDTDRGGGGNPNLNGLAAIQ